MAEALDVHLYGTVIGQMVRSGPDAVTFETSAAAMDRFGVGSRILSRNLPLGPRPSSPAAATAFFGGLLPEGTGLTNLAKQAGAAANDVFALVGYAGRDVAGAIRIGGADEPVERYEPLTDAQVAERLDRINDYNLGVIGGGGSLAGYQPKTTLALLDGTWHAGIDGAASTHIIKPVGAGAEPALYAEAYCLDLSRRCGLTSYASTTRRFGERLVLVIERYDRTVRPDGTVERIHQEDAAQALGLPWRTDSKFEGVNPAANLRNVAALLPRRRSILGTGTDDREALLAYTAFNTAIGNTDAHAKNFSTLHHPGGGITLAPLYDVSAHTLAVGGNLNVSMRIAGKAYQPDITRDDLLAEGTSWGVEPGIALRVVNDTLEQLRYAVEDADQGQASSRLPLYIANQARNLLDGRRAAVSAESPSLAVLAQVPPMPPR
ncbi:type II toxin-antitoxin system HipA family toxin [Pseudarthrobacter sp. O4]|uniref:type II toxin-antitoxin system HipA family toxin n=1 Tax=Pseudarthrobacter sp. O4 TaxID=3418417 RepID=UPI003CF7F01C